MLKLIVFLAVFILCTIIPAEATQPSLIRGTPAAPGVFPEAIYIQNEQGSRCSASVIGKRVLITAAHCIEDSKVIRPVSKKLDFVAVCDAHIKYDGEDFDLALCHTETSLESIKPASLIDRGPRSGELVLLSGYGCTTSKRRGGNDGIFRIGFSRIESLPGLDNTFYTRSETILCSGDSGGATYMNATMESEMHYIYGINARTDFVSLSIMQAVYTDEAKKWFMTWSKRRHAGICGLNLLCDMPKRTARPPLPDD